MTAPQDAPILTKEDAQLERYAAYRKQTGEIYRIRKSDLKQSIQTSLALGGIGAYLTFLVALFLSELYIASFIAIAVFFGLYLTILIISLIADHVSNISEYEKIFKQSFVKGKLEPYMDILSYDIKNHTPPSEILMLRVTNLDWTDCIVKDRIKGVYKDHAFDYFNITLYDTTHTIRKRAFNGEVYSFKLSTPIDEPTMYEKQKQPSKAQIVSVMATYNVFNMELLPDGRYRKLPYTPPSSKTSENADPATPLRTDSRWFNHGILQLARHLKGYHFNLQMIDDRLIIVLDRRSQAFSFRGNVYLSGRIVERDLWRMFNVLNDISGTGIIG